MWNVSHATVYNHSVKISVPSKWKSKWKKYENVRTMEEIMENNEEVKKREQEEIAYK